MKRLLVSICCAATCTPTFAYIGYGSNMDDYPAFRESEPIRPAGRERWEFDHYRRQVEAYLEDADKYIKNCDEDIEAIRQRQREAARKANNVVDDFNNWANGGY